MLAQIVQVELTVFLILVKEKKKIYVEVAQVMANVTL